jgi:hypothetical protein
MQGAQKLRNEACIQVGCNDEVEAQRRRWTFYETIKISSSWKYQPNKKLQFPCGNGASSFSHPEFPAGKRLLEFPIWR